MTKKTNKTIPPTHKFNKFSAAADFGGAVEIDAWTVENRKPIVSIEVDDGSSDGRPWGCSGITTAEITDPNTLRLLADSLLEAAEYIDKINAERTRKTKATLKKRGRTVTKA
jgi:hypothetical protein